jgi:hypothetical protein
MYLGLRNAAQTFHRVINDILRGLDFFFVCIDYVSIASSNEDDHEKLVCTVFVRFRNRHRFFFSDTSSTVKRADQTPNVLSLYTSGRYQRQKNQLQRFLRSSNFLPLIYPQRRRGTIAVV